MVGVGGVGVGVVAVGVVELAALAACVELSDGPSGTPFEHPASATVSAEAASAHARERHDRFISGL